MKISVEKILKDNIYNLMRQLGYRMQRKEGDQVSFIRPLDRSGFPRFHIYYKEGAISLHLDQKRPVYRGSSAHSGDYEGEAVCQEAERIKKAIHGKR